MPSTGLWGCVTLRFLDAYYTYLQWESFMELRGWGDKKRLYVWNLIETSLREIKYLPALTLALGFMEVALSVLGGKCGTCHMKKTPA